MDVYPMEYLERLETVSLSVLLRDFFGYLATSVDIFESVLTLRGQGEVRRGTGWVVGRGMWEGSRKERNKE